VGYVDLRCCSVQEAADLLIEKLGGAQAALARQLAEQTWVAAFGVLMGCLENSGDLPPEAPSDYPTLCDWLTEDLMARLARAPLKNPRFTEDARSGETLSVRVAFEWCPSEGPVEFGGLDWWELLELLPYAEVYGSANGMKGAG